MRLFFTAIIISYLFLLQGCASFKPLPNGVNKISEISGIYFNDFDSTSVMYSNKFKLWNHIDKKNENLENGLLVKIEITADNKLKAKLIKKDKIIAEKTINGKTTENNCYYKKRIFYVVPILPILWWFKNDQTRFYYLDNCLVVDWTFNTAGVTIIMAGGDKENFKYYFKKLSK